MKTNTLLQVHPWAGNELLLLNRVYVCPAGLKLMITIDFYSPTSNIPTLGRQLSTTYPVCAVLEMEARASSWALGKCYTRWPMRPFPWLSLFTGFTFRPPVELRGNCFELWMVFFLQVVEKAPISASGRHWGSLTQAITQCDQLKPMDVCWVGGG